MCWKPSDEIYETTPKYYEILQSEFAKYEINFIQYFENMKKINKQNNEISDENNNNDGSQQIQSIWNEKTLPLSFVLFF